MSDDTVATGKVVLIHYTLTDDEGEELDSSQGEEPLPYLHGEGNLVPGLERELEGRKVGDKFKVRVPPEVGYGDRVGPGAQAVPRTAFPEGAELEPGLSIVAEDDDGNATPLWITEVREDTVMVDVNHPLAGVALNFEVEIVSIREATAQEREHGHPHGPDGHHTH